MNNNNRYWHYWNRFTVSKITQLSRVSRPWGITDALEGRVVATFRLRSEAVSARRALAGQAVAQWEAQQAEDDAYAQAEHDACSDAAYEKHADQIAFDADQDPR